MATVTSWAADLAEFGAVYPFVGNEGLLVAVCFAVWIGWHLWQLRHERQSEEEVLRAIREGRRPPSGGDSDESGG